MILDINSIKFLDAGMLNKLKFLDAGMLNKLKFLDAGMLNNRDASLPTNVGIPTFLRFLQKFPIFSYFVKIKMI